jgi:cell division topological specificity factor
MKILSLFRRQGSAPQARERLQILLSHERAAGRQPDLLAILQEEILATIARQITVERENVRVRIDRGATVSTLEIDVDIPHTAGPAAAALASNRGTHAAAIVRGAAAMASFSRGFG